jgi:hypothetical protein
MLKIKINFADNANQGSFALDSIAETLGGNWSGKSSSSNFGIVTDVDANNLQWAEEVLISNEDVASFDIIEE